MKPLTHDAPTSRFATGIAFALVSSTAFGMSGTLGRGLMDIGWTAGAATLVRVAIAAAVLLVPGILALRGRWELVRRGWATIVAYGVFAVAGAQLFYFLAVGYMAVSVALLIEYLAPVAVVGWMWLRHGNRPTRVTLGGAGIAFAGLIGLLDVLGGGPVSIVGIGWALAAMVGASVYFVISGDTSNELPPLTLAAGGLLSALIALGLAAMAGVVPVSFSTGDVVFQNFAAPWWAVVSVLGIVTAAVSYVAGIAAARRLGARLASFVALSEVVAAATFAWLLLGQSLGTGQLVGAALVLVGVVVVKLGEGRTPAGLATAEPVPVELSPSHASAADPSALSAART